MGPLRLAAWGGTNDWKSHSLQEGQVLHRTLHLSDGPNPPLLSAPVLSVHLSLGPGSRGIKRHEGLFHGHHLPLNNLKKDHSLPRTFVVSFWNISCSKTLILLLSVEIPITWGQRKRFEVHSCVPYSTAAFRTQPLIPVGVNTGTQDQCPSECMGQIQEKQVKFRSPGQTLMAGVDVQPNSSERHLPPRKPSLWSHVLSQGPPDLWSSPDPFNLRSDLTAMNPVLA